MLMMNQRLKVDDPLPIITQCLTLEGVKPKFSKTGMRPKKKKFKDLNQSYFHRILKFWNSMKLRKNFQLKLTIY